jgi:uncharacterized protein YidB (DUF937 family)
MSGLLGQILGNVLGGQGQQGQPQAGAAIASILQQVLSGGGSTSAGSTSGGAAAGGLGGLGGLLSQLQSAGLGSQVQSWVGTGQNQPVSPDQIGQAFSPQQIAGWAAQAGTTPDAMRAVLAEALPQAVDHVTPAGQMPAPDAAPDLQALLGKLLGGAAR